MTVAELRTRRESHRLDLAAGRRHLLADLRKPAPEIANMPIGDLLCWCEGLEEARVVRILAAAGVAWGSKVRRVTGREQAKILFQVKARHPEVWEAWKASLRGGGA